MVCPYRRTRHQYLTHIVGGVTYGLPYSRTRHQYLTLIVGRVTYLFYEAPYSLEELCTSPKLASLCPDVLLPFLH